MFHHHHEHDEKSGTGDDASAQIEGMVLAIDPLPSDNTRSRVRVQVWFEQDKQMAEFHAELPNLYQPEPGSPDAQRLADFRSTQKVKHPGKIPKIQMPISAGSHLPLHYNAAKRKDFVVDEAALRQRAVHEYIENEKRAAARNAAKQPAAPVTGPPWEVPAICPTCGAPIDQAKASTDHDPMCAFCKQPIPAKPLARS